MRRSYKVLQGIKGYKPQHFLSTSIASWCLELYCQNDALGPLSSWKKSGIYQCPRHKQWTELIDWSQVNLVSNATTAISNSNDKNTTLCDCHQNVCHVPHDEVRNLCTWRPTQVLKTVCTLHALDPLVVLFQSAVAMYLFLNLMKSVVASLYRQPRSLYVVQNWGIFIAPMHWFQYFSKALTTKISSQLL